MSYDFNILANDQLGGIRSLSPLETVSDSTFHRWFHSLYPDTVVSPHITDYCATCYTLKKQLSSIKVSLTRHNQQAEKNVEEITRLQDLSNDISLALAAHKKQVHLRILTERPMMQIDCTSKKFPCVNRYSTESQSISTNMVNCHQKLLFLY